MIELEIGNDPKHWMVSDGQKITVKLQYLYSENQPEIGNNPWHWTVTEGQKMTVNYNIYVVRLSWR